MKKQLLYALGAAMLLGGCSQDKFFTDDPDTRSISTTNGPTTKGGLPGIAYIKVQSALQKEILNISSGSSNITLNSTPSALSATLKSIHATQIRRLFKTDTRFEKRKHREGLDCWYVVEFDEEQNLENTIAALAADKQFEIVEKVYATSIPQNKAVTAVSALPSTRAASEMPFNDPELKRQWHYTNFGTTPRSVAGADINLFEAWKTTTGKPNVIVSIVDGGIDLTHEDLKANLWNNSKEIPGNGIDDDGNGFVDDVNGYNFVSDKGEITLDDAGHGTHVAGTVAARNNNGIGVGGIAGGDGSPDSGVRLMSCQVFEGENGGGHEEAIVYGADNGAVISQNSWGYNYPGPGYLPLSTQEAIDYFTKYAGCDDEGNQLPDSPMKGGVVIFAAGNDDKDYLSYPGAYDGTISVSAMAPDWKKAWYTNRGDWVDIMAPGGDEYYSNGMVYSTVPASIYDAKYGYMQGTSMACPHVSGIAALSVSRLGKQGFTGEALKSRLIGSLRPENIDGQNPDYKGRLGAGYIDAALTFAENRNMKPGKVTDISADAEFTSLTVRWTAVADEDDGAPARYRLYISDKELTASNYKESAPYTLIATGYKTGDAVSCRVDDLTEGTTYYVAVIAVDRWGLESDFVSEEFKTNKNNPPVIESAPHEAIRVTGSDIQKFTLKITDPDGHEVSYRLGGETRGVSASALNEETGEVKFSIRAVAPIGKHEIEITASDQLGASASIKIPFEVYAYEPPVLSDSIGDRILGIDQGTVEIELNEHFAYQSGDDVKIEAKVADGSIVTAALNGSKLSIKGNKPGETAVDVSISDGKNTALTAFHVYVVTDSTDIVYQIYPIPATSVLNVLVNPEIRKAEFTVRSIMGEKVLSESSTIDGTGPVKLDIEELSAGAYTLVVETGKGTYKKTFVKQ